MKKVAALLVSASSLVSPAMADAGKQQTTSSAVHGEASDAIVVTAPYVRDLDLLAGRSVIVGEELLRDVRGQIGDSLTHQPGVSATSFSPGASRPVLRGFQGERVRVLTDGLGTIDVSNTSADHAVTIDPLTAERIEVLHGPAVLLFGSSAIGGAVNVLDRRIPRAVPEKGYHLDATATYGTAAEERSGGSSLDVALGSGFVAHVDGSYRKTDDMRVGGYVLSPTLRAEQLALAQDALNADQTEEAEEASALAAMKGRLPNSATETWTLGGGIAFINDGGSLGFSAGYYDSRYGVPERPGTSLDDLGAEEAPVHIDMKQFRADMRGQINVGGPFIESIRVRAGYADYEHTEFEGAETGTIFQSEGFEGRLELVQADRNGWRGVIGLQGYTRDFNAIGEEAFVPRNTTNQMGLFTLQEWSLGKIGLEMAGRYEHSSVKSPSVLIGDPDTGSRVAIGRSFDSFSGAAGISYAVMPEVKLGLNLSRTTRAPSAEELFSNGPHVATQAFELGSPALKLEKSWGLEAYLRGKAGPVNFSLSAYHSWFNDYIYDTQTGAEIDGLPVFQYFQRNARYYGIEAEASAPIARIGETKIIADGVADYVRARLTDGGGPIPRIPPLRLLGGLEAQTDRLTGRFEVEWTAKQNRIAAFETATDDHILVNSSLSWRPWGKASETAIVLSANNIFDVDARRHASFTKDFVPMTGRDVRLSIRFSL